MEITQFKGASRTDVTFCQWRFFFLLKRKGEGDGVDRMLAVNGKNHEWDISVMFLSSPPRFILPAVMY